MKKRSITHILLFVLSYMCLSCSSPKDSELNLNEIGDIDLVQAFELGDKFNFGLVHDIKIDRNNNLFLLDRGQQKIIVFNRQQKLVSQIVKNTDEPIEYSRFSEIDIYADTLFVLNAPQSKLTKYYFNDTDSLNFISESIYPDRFGLSVQYFDVISSNIMLIGFMRGFTQGNLFEDRVIHLDKYFPVKREYEKILELRSRDYYRYEINGGFRVGYMPFGNYPIITSKGNSIYFGYNGESNINKYNLNNGNKDLVLNVNLEPDLLSEAAINEVSKNQFDGQLPIQVKDKLPESFPYYDTFIIDNENNIWVASNYKKINGEKLWLVFSPTGQIIYKFKLDESITLKEIRDDYVYGIKKSKNYGHSVVGYKVNRR